MTITSEIQRIKTNIANAYTSCNSKGATIPTTQNSANLATCINSISTGTAPTGTLSITANGVYDVTSYANADVSVSGGGDTEVAYIFTNLSIDPPGIYLALGDLDDFNDSARVFPQAQNSIGNVRTGMADTYYWKIEPNTNYSLFYGLGGGATSYKIKTVNINTDTIDVGEYALGGGND